MSRLYPSREENQDITQGDTRNVGMLSYLAYSCTKSLKKVSAANKKKPNPKIRLLNLY